MSKELILGHASSRALSKEEQEEAVRLLMRKKAERAVQKEKDAARREQLKGYRFWCSEGCGFVDEGHRCEQWSKITYVSPELYAAIRSPKTKGKA